MGTSNRRGPCTFLLCIFLLYIFIAIQYCSMTDTLTPYQPISVNQTLISASQIFELGFFGPGNSTNWYIGIWHKNIIQPKHVWVANRESPVNLTDSASSLTIGSDGNLELLDGKQNVVWSTNVSLRSNDTIAMLFDTGNFVLMDRVSRSYLWESFDYPCDTLLPTMKLGMINTVGEGHVLSSWQSPDDPSPGKFLVGLSRELPPQSFTLNDLKPYWRGGPWDGRFLGIPEQDNGFSNGMSIQQDTQQGIAYLTWNTYNISSVWVIIITPAGFLQILGLDQKTKKWFLNWKAPENPCDIYGICGPFGVCNKNNSRICECVKGFIPKTTEEWSKGNWMSGCVRRTELFCDKNASKLAHGRTKNDWFWKISGVKLPDHIEYLNKDAPGCKEWCFNNCSCLGYAYTGLGCMVWTTDLIDIQWFSLAGEDLFLRLAHSELGDKMKIAKLIISFTTISFVLVLCASMYGLRRWKAYQRGRRRRIEGLNFGDTSDSSNQITQEDSSQQDSSQLPTFDFAKIVAATNNFSKSNELGKGGFGTVYKGKLEDGLEIAVKRLSSHSMQGVEEFKNEIILISKLQHRNLVRLVGCCIEGGEKLIIYEYMKNKSLETFLFDPKKGVLLDWAKRFNIIQGIARGLVYLHRDSCLRVIHRDLKGSNILLDDQMNPKISDFGLARTFEITQELANTHQIVGTFGYMSPEYAVAGIFSEKSDVFSFGVMLLEIVSSKKNTSFYCHEQHINLLGYAWKLWNENRGLELIDRQAMGDSYSKSQVMRSVQVGLLCVQDQAADRPTMPAIVMMLSSETDLPQPKQPTFTFQCLLNSGLRSKYNNFSIDEASVSAIEGR